MADSEYEDYFQSEGHKARLMEAFSATLEKITAIGLSLGPLDAISEAQGAAAAVAHFYHTIGLKEQGAKYLRGCAERVEKGYA